MNGRPAKTLEILGIEPLTEADLEGIVPSGPSPLRQLRQSHHKVARLLAEGLKLVEVAAMTGYTPQRIGDLQADPSFQDLLTFYRAERDAQWADLVELMKSLSEEAASELLRRLDEDPSAVSTGQLLSILESTADRTGHAPIRRAEIKALHITGDQLAALREELEGTRAGRVQLREAP